MDQARLQQVIEGGESLTTEFKSDRKPISDSSIYEEIVALANSDGGVLVIGVEDDGTVTGAQPRHGLTTDPLKLQAAVFNNTSPNVNTRVSVHIIDSNPVIAIEVDRYPEACATASGKALRRAIKSDGTPETRPFFPHEQRVRRVELGLVDYSSIPVEGATMASLDPLEFERLRQTIVRLNGDRSLLSLADEEVAKALRLVETVDDRLVPNVAGMLLLGREQALRDYVCTHEVNFQVIDPVGDIRVNDGFHGPLLKVLEDVESRFAARNEEREVLVGLFRVPVPDYSPIGFREAVNNAVLHRNYALQGQVYVQWYDDHILITSPGGLPDGLTLDNLLVHEPKPRNPLLAEAFKRIGLIEHSGRGVDKIYLGQVRYGRPAPDYTRTDAHGVRVVLRGGEASLEFAAFVYEQDRQGKPLSLDELLVLNTLFVERRIDATAAGALIQKGTPSGRSVLEGLNERGLVDAKGERRVRVYHLSAQIYRMMGQPEGYVRAHDIDPLRYEGLVMEYLVAHGRMTRGELIELLGISVSEARAVIERMKTSGKISARGSGRRWTYYVIAE